MSEEPFIPTVERAVAVLREAEEPLTADQLLERLPPYVRKANTNPRRWLQQAVLSRPETPVCRLTLERLSQRDGARVAERNRQLADTAARVLHEARGQRLPFDLSSWLLSGDFYRHECPPDLLLMVLLMMDDRFIVDFGGEIGLATKWDRLTTADADFREAVAEIAREMAAEKQAKSIHREPFHALGRWMEAVGLLAERGAPAEETSEVGAAIGASAVYRLRVSLQYDPKIWRTIEVRGDQTFGQLDQAIRKAFEHDRSDHLSEFSVRIKGRRRTEGMGEIYPGGGGEGAALQLGAVDLKRGDTLGYLYDFGESVRHVVKVEALVKPKAGMTYPRELARNAPHAPYCVSCAERSEQERATWRCIDCSTENDTEITLCNRCLEDEEHEDHYLDRIFQ